MDIQSVQFQGSESKEIVQKTFTITPSALRPDDYLIKVTHSGLCASDLMMLQAPMTLGHEGIGIIEKTGSACTLFKVGDRVGWGPINSTCGTCDPCLSGRDAYCTNCSQYGLSDGHGSLCSHAIRKEQWLFRIPETLASEDAAPLMCGGGTVWIPLINHCKPYDRVGIVSLGGLGHLAVQFASKMGCDVVAFSSSTDKRDEAIALGASEFYAIKDVSDLSSLGLKKPIDRLILTSASGGMDEIGKFYSILATNGTVIPLFVSMGSLSIPSFPTMRMGYQIVGSCICNRFEQNKALDFAARHKVHCIVEKFPMSVAGITEAFKKLGDGKMRYRGIIAWEY